MAGQTSCLLSAFGRTMARAVRSGGMLASQVHVVSVAHAPARRGRRGVAGRVRPLVPTGIADLRAKGSPPARLARESAHLPVQAIAADRLAAGRASAQPRAGLVVGVAIAVVLGLEALLALLPGLRPIAWGACLVVALGAAMAGVCA